MDLEDSQIVSKPQSLSKTFLWLFLQMLIEITTRKRPQLLSASHWSFVSKKADSPLWEEAICQKQPKRVKSLFCRPVKIPDHGLSPGRGLVKNSFWALFRVGLAKKRLGFFCWFDCMYYETRKLIPGKKLWPMNMVGMWGALGKEPHG